MTGFLRRPRCGSCHCGRPGLAPPKGLGGRTGGATALRRGVRRLISGMEREAGFFVTNGRKVRTHAIMMHTGAQHRLPSRRQPADCLSGQGDLVPARRLSADHAQKVHGGGVERQLPPSAP